MLTDGFEAEEKVLAELFEVVGLRAVEDLDVLG